MTPKDKTWRNVPKLRFPEFRDAGEWEIQPFKKLFTIGNGRDYKHLSTGNIPVYGSGGYMLSVDEHLYDGESVCIGRKGTINNPMFLTGKFWTVDTLFYTHSFNDCLPKFIYAVFQNIEWLKHNEAGGVPSLSKGNIEKIEVAVPNPAEQQKIADCLSSLDELITAQTKKLDTLKIHKKGLMQQLFPAEGEAVPRLRFPEFREAGEWIQEELGVVAEFVSERMPIGQLKLSNYVSTENILSNYEGVAVASKLPSSGSATRFKACDVLVSNIRPYLKKAWFASKDGGASKDVIVIRSKKDL